VTIERDQIHLWLREPAKTTFEDKPPVAGPQLLCLDSRFLQSGPLERKPLGDQRGAWTARESFIPNSVQCGRWRGVHTRKRSATKLLFWTSLLQKSPTNAFSRLHLPPLEQQRNHFIHPTMVTSCLAISIWGPNLLKKGHCRPRCDRRRLAVENIRSSSCRFSTGVRMAWPT
jgi:hypothetical protein